MNNDRNCALLKWCAGGGPETGIYTTWSGLIVTENPNVTEPKKISEDTGGEKQDRVTGKSFTKPDKVTEQRDTKPDNESRATSKEPDEVPEQRDTEDAKNSKLDEVVSEERDTKGRKSTKKRNTNAVADTKGILIS